MPMLKLLQPSWSSREAKSGEDARLRSEQLETAVVGSTRLDWRRLGLINHLENRGSISSIGDT